MQGFVYKPYVYINDKPYASIHLRGIHLWSQAIIILAAPDRRWEVCWLVLAEDVSTNDINSIRLLCKFFVISCSDVSYKI